MWLSHPDATFSFFFLFLIINLLFIGIQFAHIQNNTQCSARQYTSHIHPHPHPPPLPSPLVHFPELVVFMICLPFWYFPQVSSPFPYIPFHYYLYSPNEWEHTMFVLLRLTYFTQHDTIQFHPRWIKWWVFVVSHGWARPTFSLSSSSESPMIWMLLFL